MPSQKIFLIRQGVDNAASLMTSSHVNKSSDCFRSGFSGRLDPVEGVHVLVETFKPLLYDVKTIIRPEQPGGPLDKL
jgi:hypothetical protein